MANIRIINIMSMRIARDLIKHDRFKTLLLDIERNNLDSKRTVFVFQGTSEIKEYLNKNHNLKF